MPRLCVFPITARAKLRCRRRLSSFLHNLFVVLDVTRTLCRKKRSNTVTGNATHKQRWRISGNPSFSLARVTNERINGGQAQREREASHALHRHARAGYLDEYMAASWYNSRHRYVDNQRVKLKIVLPTTAMAKLAIDSASLESLYS